MGKCIICRRRGPGRPVVDDYVLCHSCNRTYCWTPRYRYIRRRMGETKWAHQAALEASMEGVLRSMGEDPRRLVTEVGYPDWGLSRVGGLLRFDMAVPKWALLVDYHGQQHYTPHTYYHRTRAAYDRQRENDQLKRERAPMAGYTYVIFTYREEVGNEEWVKMRLHLGGQ